MVRLFIRTRTHEQLSGVDFDNHHEPPMAHPEANTDNDWILPGWGWYDDSGRSVQSDRVYYIPIYCASDLPIHGARIDVMVADAGTVARIGLYAGAIGSDGRVQIGALLADWGTVSTASTGDVELVIDATLPQGYSFLTIGHQGSPTLRMPADNAFAVWPVTAGNTSYAAMRNAIPYADVGNGEDAFPNPHATIDGVTSVIYAQVIIAPVG